MVLACFFCYLVFFSFSQQGQQLQFLNLLSLVFRCSFFSVDFFQNFDNQGFYRKVNFSFSICCYSQNYLGINDFKNFSIYFHYQSVEIEKKLLDQNRVVFGFSDFVFSGASRIYKKLGTVDFSLKKVQKNFGSKMLC